MRKLFLLLASASLVACTSSEQVEQIILDAATKHLTNQCAIIDEATTFINPKTFKGDTICYIPQDDWCSGFFPGTILQMYKLTGDSLWLERGLRYTEALDTIMNLKWHHDVGFMVMASYGQAYNITGNPIYKDAIITAANSLATRFRPAAGVIQSWDEDRGWQGKRGWMCPTIIDNMMNIELFFEASRLTGDTSYYKMAISHADTTLLYHFRPDFSTYHVVDYDKVNGGVRSRCTAQGYADESCWSRGEAWALYSYTMCYRYTKNEAYLKQAKAIFEYIFNNSNLPYDLVPYWDFNAPNIPNDYRDASAAAVICSALYELSQWESTYINVADRLLRSLATTKYLAEPGTNGNFLLKHCVGSIPHNSEIDVPLNYADYYFLEALCRKMQQ